MHQVADMVRVEVDRSVSPRLYCTTPGWHIFGRRHPEINTKMEDV